MRAAVLSIFALAALCGGVSAFPSSSSAFKVRTVARKAQATSCFEALAAVETCMILYGNQNDQGASVRANCCQLVDQLSVCGGENVFNLVTGVFEQTTAFNLAQVVGAMQLLGSCSRTGNSDATCSAKIAEATACSQLPASEGVNCCPIIADELQACIGQSTGSADRPEQGGTGNNFWQSYNTQVDTTGCQPFPDNLCITAATSFSTCVAVVDTGDNSQFNDYSDCCHWQEWLSMFCDNKPATLWFDYAPPEDVRNNLATTCNKRGPSSGTGSGTGSGSFFGSNTGSGYPPVNCNWDRVAYSFAKYTDASGYSQLVTNSQQYAVGYYYDPNNWQNTVYPTPWFTDSRGFNYYPVDWSKVPSELNYKLQPRNPMCYGPPSRR